MTVVVVMMMIRRKMMITTEPVVVFLCFLFLFFSSSSSQTQTKLPPDEVAALQQIAKSLGKTDWNFSVDPCSGESGWRTLQPQKGSENEVACTCNATVCHVTSIFLKTQGLSGTLPKDLSGLPFLTQLDLTRNYLSGSIPAEWGKLQLVNVSLMSNRLSGPIPVELGNMSTLKNITIENNQFSGELPPHLGNLTNLERLIVSSNNFTGPLPTTMARLTNMTDFRISDNGFSGRLPDYIGKWTRLNKLMIQGTDLEGPIPSLASLSDLIFLMISDIKGAGSNFPQLGKMNLVRLILRNCNVYGEIPDYLGDMTNLQIIDLSFNSLTGTLPNSMRKLQFLRTLFLTSNNLSGPIPDWIFKWQTITDLSVNNFTATSGGPFDCQQRTVNLAESYSPTTDNRNVACPYWINNFSCIDQRKRSSFHIACGSKTPITTKDGAFEEDGVPNGAATFFLSHSAAWAMSSTGVYVDDAVTSVDYAATNTSILQIPNPELFMTARHSPLSLKYYGLCLVDGPYTVTLYFAELVFADNITNDKNFSSLGRRIFDVYIQGKLVLKDFNIKDAANGSGKAVTRQFSANVTNGILKIHLFWAGKGTTVVPTRGDYGPLVSAVSVNADFEDFQHRAAPKKNTKVIVIVVVSIGGLIILILGILYIFSLKKVHLIMELSHEKQKLTRNGTDVAPSNLSQIKAATRNFHPSNKIGEGGFGPVYKGQLSNGTVIAIKQLSSKSQQGNREFITEMGMISALQHPNLVRLHGCCIEGNELLLVYEYMENNSLAHALSENGLELDWPTRRKICIGVAKGLMYLHEESRLKIVHRDIKASNILLDRDLNAKISDFGLAKLDEDENACNNTRIVGTQGYMAPEYALHGELTCKVDVYSFGIVALEVVSGKRNTDRQSEECIYLLELAYHLREKGDLLKLMDPKLGENFSKEEALVILNVALLCTNDSPLLRPDMSTVVNMIEGKIPIQPQSVSSSSEGGNITIHFDTTPHTWTRDGCQEGPWTASSTSMASKEDTKEKHHITAISEDLYPTETETMSPGSHPDHAVSQSCERSSPRFPMFFWM